MQAAARFSFQQQIKGSIFIIFKLNPNMNIKLQQLENLKADLLLLLVAFIWGFGFVAQRAGMEHIGPFTYNAIRFFLGGLCLLPFVLRESRRPRLRPVTIKPWIAGILAGTILFGGATLQQVGIKYTTAGKAGFITGLYVVLVPILGMVFGQRTGKGTWVGTFLAVGGLYLLTVEDLLSMGSGDLLVLAGALFWAVHVLLLGFLSPRTGPVRLAMDQFFYCAILSLVVALCTEETRTASILAAAVPILYGGMVSVGGGYTLQVVAQQKAKPAHAAIILSLETVFAVIGGCMLLGETLGGKAILGCLLMLAGMISSQIRQEKKPNN